MTISEYYKAQSYLWTKQNWRAWEARVRALEAEGLDRSDAQAVTDVEFARAI